MKVVITAEEMQQIVADFMSRQTAFGEVSGVTFSVNGATVFFNEEPAEEDDYEDDVEDSVSTTGAAPKKNRRRRRTKAEMKAAQETVETEPEEQEPVVTAVEVEATTEPADIDTPVEDDLLSTTEEPAVDTTAEPDLFTEDDDDLFK